MLHNSENLALRCFEEREVGRPYCFAYLGAKLGDLACVRRMLYYLDQLMAFKEFYRFVEFGFRNGREIILRPRAFYALLDCNGGSGGYVRF